MEDAREAAIDLWKEWEIQLQDARSKLEHWKYYYEDELKTYRQCVQDGEIDVTKSVFDVTMLQGVQAATADLIRAEQECEEVKKQARNLGVAFGDDNLVKFWGFYW